MAHQYQDGLHMRKKFNFFKNIQVRSAVEIKRKHTVKKTALETMYTRVIVLMNTL